MNRRIVPIALMTVLAAPLWARAQEVAPSDVTTDEDDDVVVLPATAESAEAAGENAQGLIVTKAPPGYRLVPVNAAMDLRPPRITLSLQLADLAVNALQGGAMFAIAANDNNAFFVDSTNDRAFRIAGGIFMGLSAVNLYGTIHSAIELSRRKQGEADPMSKTFARSGIALSSISMFRWYGIGILSFAVLNDDDFDSDDRGFLIASGVIRLGFGALHTLALSKNVKDLRRAKRLGENAAIAASNRKIQFTGSGFVW